jgi:hypothetical protein
MKYSIIAAAFCQEKILMEVFFMKKLAQLMENREEELERIREDLEICTGTAYAGGQRERYIEGFLDGLIWSLDSLDDAFAYSEGFQRVTEARRAELYAREAAESGAEYAEGFVNASRFLEACAAETEADAAEIFALLAGKGAAA